MIMHTDRRRPRSAGFTLVELMITVVIAAVLVSIAIPSYTAQIRKSRRTEAKSALLDLAGREERYYNTNNKYSYLAADLGYASAGSTVSLAVPMTVGSGYYQITVSGITAGTTATPAAYTVTATAINTQAADTNCATFTVNSMGQQTAAPDPNTDCWK